MQLIRPVPVTAEQYVQENFHQQIRAPENCPNCQHAHSLEALCYYWRYVTSMLAAVLRIQVRRFLCRHCRVSVSCLPDFAQPYRLVNTSTVQGGLTAKRPGLTSSAGACCWAAIGRALNDICLN